MTCWVEFWGVRGSLPSPGSDTVRYGGNTSCLALRPSEGQLVVLDAGSGIRPLSATVGPEVQRVDVLMTHLHMDHIQGLGFFAPLFDPGPEVHLWGPRSAHRGFRERLLRYLSAPLFPVHLHDLPCKLFVHDAPLDTFEVGDVVVAADLVCHPGSTLGYRITVDGASLAYLPDHEPVLAMPDTRNGRGWRSGEQIAGGADLLVHDAQFDATDYEQRVGWGHSAWDHALAYGAAVGAKTLVPFHFDPTYSDGKLDELFAVHPDGVRVRPAREGLRLSLGSADD